MSGDNYKRCPECKHPDETLREDYEFYWKNDRTVVASYGCFCDNCKFEHSFNYESDTSMTD